MRLSINSGVEQCNVLKVDTTALSFDVMSPAAFKASWLHSCTAAVVMLFFGVVVLKIPYSCSCKTIVFTRNHALVKWFLVVSKHDWWIQIFFCLQPF